MQGSYLNNLFRVFTAEPSNAGRWSDTDVYTLLTEAQNWLAQRVEWPIIHLAAAPPNGTQNGVQEYTLPDQLQKIKRVYVAGQACVPTDLDTLEGDTIEYYDQSQTTTFKPLWSSSSAAAYPVSNTIMGFPQGVSPYFVGARPTYYDNGGNIGFTPVPAGQYQMDIWGIGLPNALTAAGSVCDYPQLAATCIAWKAAELAFAADSQLERAALAAQKALEASVDVRVWRQDFFPKRSRGWKPIPYRHFYNRNSILGKRGSSSYGE